MNIVLTVLIWCLSLFIFVGAVVMAVAMWKLYREVFPRKCHWINSDDVQVVYKTACKEEFHNAVDNGDPVTDWANNCPYCGGVITLKQN